MVAQDAAGHVSPSADLTVSQSAPPPPPPLPLGALVHDGPATPEQIALFLPVTGPLPQTATTTVRYRVQGSSSWIWGHPLYRIRPAWSEAPSTGTLPEAFAWPIIGLLPGTTYEVEVTVTDGPRTEVKTLTHTTRALPGPTGPPTTTIPAGASSASIQTAFNGLRPGDVLQFADGTYAVDRLILDRSGTPSRPIVIRGASRTGVVLSRPTGRLLYLLNASYVVLEHLTLQGSGVDSGMAASSVGIEFYGEAPTQTGVTVRNVTMRGVDWGIVAQANVAGLLAYDNTLIGNNTWTPTLLNTNATWNDDGINVGGSGNCAFNNTLTGFGDAFAYASHAGGVAYSQAIGVHFYRNEVRNAGDDLVEVDYGQRNITFYDNRSHNSMTFVSLDPLLGGPFLAARNVAINVGRPPYKWNSQNSGQFVYNNTVIRTTGKAWVDNTPTAEAGWIQHKNGAQRAYGYRNNILLYLGAGTQTLRLDNTGHDPVDFTHNAWYPNKTFSWLAGGVFPTLVAAYAGLPATRSVFSALTKRHAQDVITVANPWTTTVTLGANYRTEVTETYTPQLAPGTTPKSTGVVIPNITDGFSGAAPDRGALIEGRAVPHYGDRTPGPP